MKPFRELKQFVRVKDGFVSVEWIALAASLAVAAVAIGFMVMQSGSPVNDPRIRELVQTTDGTGAARGDTAQEHQTAP